MFPIRLIANRIQNGWLTSLFVTACLISPTATVALSCGRTSDHFFIECNSNTCQVAFRARDIPAGSCPRRTVIDDPPPDVSAVLLAKAAQHLTLGKYEITLLPSYYGSPTDTGELLERVLQAEATVSTPPFNVQRLPDDVNLKQLRNEWNGRALSSLLQYIASWVIEFVLFAIALWGLLYTLAEYRKRLSRQPPRRLLAPVAMQAVLFLATFYVFAFTIPPMLVGGMAPILLCVWVYELAAYLLIRIR